MDLKSLEAVEEVDESGKEPMEQSTLMETHNFKMGKVGPTYANKEYFWAKSENNI